MSASRDFEELTAPYRRELQFHCYRMLGSVQDAEDLVQETWLRAWRSFEKFEGDAVRAWLYRIATHACLNALESRERRERVLPDATRAPAASPALEPASPELPWLEPWVEDAQGQYVARETVRLAFIAAIQRLPPRQRAAVLLCEVLGWPAAEVATLLETSPAAVNSALQRARETLSTPASEDRPSDAQRELLARYVRSWETHDLDGFVALLKHDATFTMPPWSQWYSGRDAIRAFFAEAWKACHGLQLRPLRVNGGPGFAIFERSADGSWAPHSLHALELEGDAVARLTTWVGPLGERLVRALVR